MRAGSNRVVYDVGQSGFAGIANIPQTLNERGCVRRRVGGGFAVLGIIGSFSSEWSLEPCGLN
jgi:hypothetical protein